MNRPKSTGRNLPPRMLRRTKTLASGKVWVGYYYNGRDQDGKRKEIPLGTDLNEAKRKWADLECKPVPVDANTMAFVFDRYEREIIPTKAPRTQTDNRKELVNLRKAFGSAPVSAVTPQHIAQYRDARSAKTRANRELALLSHVFNLAREWGYLSGANPCFRVRKNKETPRDYYASPEVWDAVYACAEPVLRDAMDIAYLTGQRPADVLKMRVGDIRDGALEVKQGKTGKRLRILLRDENSALTGLGEKVDAIRSATVLSLFLIATSEGKPLTATMLRKRWDAARELAAQQTPALADQIKQFQFRDIRPKAASETELEHASKLLGHSGTKITETVYRRIGESVKPTR